MRYQNVLDNQQGQALDEDSLTSYQVWAIQQRCAMICLALTVVVKEKITGISWEKCCELVIQYASTAVIKLTSRPRTVMEWYHCFRSKQKFEIPQRKKITYLHSYRQIQMFALPCSSTMLDFFGLMPPCHPYI